MTDASHPPSQPPRSRRDFLRQGSTAVLAAAAIPRVHGGSSELLRVGLVGCGGRGTGAAANALRADPHTRLVAMGDTFGDFLANSLRTLQGAADIAAQVQVDEDHRFTGFDAYQGVIDSSDVVLLATPPHFRPTHMRAAVDAGKHLFVEKPVAVDAPGVRSVLESAARAKAKGLSVVSGLCYRYSDAKRETLERIHDGSIGDVVALQCTYNTGALWYRERQPDWSDMEWQVRNWLYFTWLSGDHINEQHIHSLDKIAWARQDEYPVKCTASGGRSARTDAKYGNVFDHFNVVYEWADGVRGFASCRQLAGASTDVSDHVFGTRGVASLQAHRIRGEKAWRWRSDEPDDMYQNEHDALFASIRDGAPIDDSHHMCHSTLMAIMGRMAAYTGQTITREQALSSTEDLSPPAYDWTELPVAAVARPGVTQFV